MRRQRVSIHAAVVNRTQIATMSDERGHHIGVLFVIDKLEVGLRHENEGRVVRWLVVPSTHIAFGDTPPW